jgi:hypothetical protein
MRTVLLNLLSKFYNPDGSISLFDVYGDATETIYSDYSYLLYAAPNTSTPAATVPVWFAPFPTQTVMSSITHGTATFQSLMANVPVFDMPEGMLTLPDSVLKPFFAYLSAHNIQLAIEGMPLVATAGSPGFGLESLSGNAGDLTNLLGKIKSDGGKLGYVAWDEPWYYGDYSTGIDNLSQLASQVAKAASQVKALFPTAQIGDIEPIGGDPTEQAQLQAWFAAYQQASGSQFSFFQEDIGSWLSGWENSAAGISQAAHADGMQVGAIVDGSWNATTSQQWATQAVSLAAEISSNPLLRPDYFIVQSWQSVTDDTMDPTISGTLASVLQTVMNSVAQSGTIPAVAAYSAGGQLNSVTWSGGWSASHSGASLAFSSPTGTTLETLSWSNVRNFVFSAQTGDVTLTEALAPATGNAAEVDATYLISNQGGSFSVTPNTATLTELQQMGLASSALGSTSTFGLNILGAGH